ncbi:hypothetical protein NDU88_002502 [Pleurodeles waltl]|uniref:Uncharacterized protein n=1 Tax=Pleurodeles waltl TaxID=8319 RepID=A0AAV7UBB8_PLEWA|nr:hypothetical protein NDU88_002502 [Pleurodeles waltl]
MHGRCATHSRALTRRGEERGLLPRRRPPLRRKALHRRPQFREVLTAAGSFLGSAGVGGRQADAFSVAGFLLREINGRATAAARAPSGAVIHFLSAVQC